MDDEERKWNVKNKLKFANGFPGPACVFTFDFLFWKTWQSKAKSWSELYRSHSKKEEIKLHVDINEVHIVESRKYFIFYLRLWKPVAQIEHTRNGNIHNEMSRVDGGLKNLCQEYDSLPYNQCYAYVISFCLDLLFQFTFRPHFRAENY